MTLKKHAMKGTMILLMIPADLHGVSSHVLANASCQRIICSTVRQSICHCIGSTPGEIPLFYATAYSHANLKGR